MIYLDNLPDDIPHDRVLVHNRVRPAKRLNSRGFRAWLQPPAGNLETCSCGWAAELPPKASPENYRVRMSR
jgi:hypothetical protein